MTMRISATLFLYFGRHFLMAMFVVFIGLAGVVFLFDFIELLRRAASNEDATIGLVLQMTLLKLPYMAQTMLPLAVLFGAMVALWRLTRNQELVVARSAGVSAWQFLLPALSGAFIVGVVQIAILNPIASATIGQFERLENKFIRGQESFLSVSEGGVWLRQNEGTNYSILNARRIAQDTMAIRDITVFLFEENDKFIGRIDAASGVLEDGFWQFRDVTLASDQLEAQHLEEYRLPTDLTAASIMDSFAAPETMSFWELPGFIEVLEEAGFSAQRHRLYWHSLTSIPVLLCASVLIAACFSMRQPRRGGTLLMIAGGIGAGFLIYVFSDLIYALGISGRLPVLMAAWSPAVIATLLGLATIMHLEDG